CALAPGHEGLLSNGTMLNGGLIAGALIGALLAGEFKVRVPRQRRRYGQSVVGGVLMG
ncbi:MAG: YeeE/YedE family protein, partial [Anaerolineae bacterium]|nr:YeeE/YedE family protein [Anaerolineae bacterium]